MGNYICKLATLDEVINKANEEVKKHPNNKMWEIFKERAINNFKNKNTLVYVGVLNDEIICEATSFIKEDGMREEVNNLDGLLSKNMVYLSGFRTNKEFEGQGYFSKLFKYMENDLREKGYNKMCLGVEPCEVRNMQIYFKWGFTNYIKTNIEYLPSEDGKQKGRQEIVNYYYKEI